MNFALNRGVRSAVTGDGVNFGAVWGNITQVNQATLRGLGRPSKRLAVGNHRPAAGDPAVSAEFGFTADRSRPGH